MKNKKKLEDLVDVPRHFQIAVKELSCEDGKIP